MSNQGHDQEPELTVGLIIGAERQRAGRSLRHLLAQSAIERIEIVCVDLAPDAAPIPETTASGVRYIPALDFRFIEDGMARCVEEASAPLLAFIEDHSYAEPEWAERLIRAFDRPDVAMVNYSFVHGGAGTYLDRAFLVTEYGRWMAPTYARPVSIAACNNIAYRLEALAPYRASIGDRMGMAPVLHTEIQDAGGIVWQEPGAIVAHEGWSSLRDGCWANGIMKRMYAGYLSRNGGWGLPRRLFYAASMSVAPALHLIRLAWSFRDRPRLWGTFLSALPVSVTIYVYASFQEALGYLLGPGRSREEFTAMELAVPRQR